MGTDYKLLVKDTAGDTVAEVTDFLDLAYSKPVNAPGLLEVRLPDGHPVTTLLGQNYQVEVHRRNRDIGLDWGADFAGVYRYRRQEYTDRGVFIAKCPGVMWWLGTRIVAWYAGVSNRSLFTGAKAETVMKTLVSYNLGASATTANGRLRAGVMAGISVQADGAGGNTVDLVCPYANLLAALQKLASVAGGDFDLVSTGAAAWEFRWYTGQRGTDKTATVVFSLPWGNMAKPVYTEDRMDEASVAIAGGAGEGSGRYISVVEGAEYDATDNNIEVFADASSTVSSAGRIVRANEVLEGAWRKREFSFSVMQTPGCAYGVDYVLGDKVTGMYSAASETFKISRVDVGLSSSGEEAIDVQLDYLA